MEVTIIRKVKLSMNEQKKYDVIKSLADHPASNKQRTPHEWIPGQIWHLHLAIDDATGRINGGWFDTQETLNGYYHVFHQILTAYGIPYKFFTDRRTIFTYKKKNSPSIDEDTYTQFAYACKQLGVELETSSVPTSKRTGRTLKSDATVAPANRVKTCRHNDHRRCQ